jgi:cytochrome c-type biogenesis protein CcmH
VIAQVLRRLIFALLSLHLLAAPAAAVEPSEMLADPALEARARHLSEGLRCLVCRNQSIDDSNAELARDLRVLLRERLSAGDTDEQAVAYLVGRYGNYILLQPPLMTSTVLLWAGPAILLLLAGLGFGIMWRRQSKTRAPREEFSDEDRALIAQTLGTKDVQ